MRILRTLPHLCLALTLSLGAVGCATTPSVTQKENLAIAAGFKVITPTKPDQKAILEKLPPGKVTPVTYRGKSYYVLPDAAANQAYVGGPAEYQTYQELRKAKQLSNENLLSRPSAQPAGWESWGGWGNTSGMGGPPIILSTGNR